MIENQLRESTARKNRNSKRQSPALLKVSEDKGNAQNTAIPAKSSCWYRLYIERETPITISSNLVNAHYRHYREKRFKEIYELDRNVRQH